MSDAADAGKDLRPPAEAQSTTNDEMWESSTRVSWTETEIMDQTMLCMELRTDDSDLIWGVAEAARVSGTEALKS